MSDLKIIYIFLIIPLRAAWKIILFTFISCLLIASVFYAIAFNTILEIDILNASPEDIRSVVNWKPKDNTKIFDQSGNLLSEQFSQYHDYVAFNEIPKELVQAIVSIEDRKYWMHNGIDVYSILRAGIVYLENGHIKQGASTITQQVVKNLLLSNEKTLSRKLREIVLSLYIEQKLSKEKILEIYCNQIFLGFGSYGVSAAAKRYFDKSLSELTIAESALIAGLFQLPGQYNPKKYPERAKQRQLEVLVAMHDAGYVDDVSKEVESNRELVYSDYHSRTKLAAPYFVDNIVEEAKALLSDFEDISLKDSGLKIYTSLDLGLQKLAGETFNQSNSIFEKMEKNLILDKESKDIKASHVEGALLALDRRTGEVRAMIGGRDYDDSQFNRTTHALRAPGSTFKPITYSLALEKGKKWNELYYIAPITIGNYRPRTELAKLFTETTLLEAFYKSINSPAVTVGNQLGINQVIRHAKRLGIATPVKEEAASLLGSSEVSMFELAKVYNTFANTGNRIDPISITKIVDSKDNIIYEASKLQDRTKRVMSKTSGELIAQGLKEVVRRGTAYKISHLSHYAAGKTGTSNQSKDNWFAGHTDDLVVVVWLGNDHQNSFRGNISASNTAVPLWGNFIQKANKYLRTSRLPPPSSLKGVKVNPQYGHLDPAGIKMYFRAQDLPKRENSDLMRINNGEKMRLSLNEI